jgi:RNA polymerase sigma-70 factor, ECF subfamily
MAALLEHVRRPARARLDLLPWALALMGSPSDEELVARLRLGDAQALRSLMERYRGPLHGYLVRLLGSTDDAEDLFQDAWLRVLRNAARFDERRAFRPWLYAIATNLVRNTYRARSYRDALSLDRPGGGEGGDEDAPSLVSRLAGRGPQPGDEAERDESARQVRDAVGELPEKGRAALVLFYYQGLSYEEIGEALEIPVGTVKSRIHNAVARLAKVLGPEGSEEAP